MAALEYSEQVGPVPTAGSAQTQDPEAWATPWLEQVRASENAHVVPAKPGSQSHERSVLIVPTSLQLDSVSTTRTISFNRSLTPAHPLLTFR